MDYEKKPETVVIKTIYEVQELTSTEARRFLDEYKGDAGLFFTRCKDGTYLGIWCKDGLKPYVEAFETKEECIDWLVN